MLETKAKEYDNDLDVIKKAIESRLKTNDVLNKKLAQLIDAAGGKEQDPLQIEVKQPNTFKIKISILNISSIDRFVTWKGQFTN